MNIETENVFAAVRRGYNDLELADERQIIDYFASVRDETRIGHVSNVKGILFEILYVENLVEQGITASLFEAPNHSLVDIAVEEESGVALEMQLKATENAAYVISAMHETPEIIFVATSEVAAGLAHTGVVNSGIPEAALSEAISENLFKENLSPFSGLSIIRWLIGIPF